MERANTESQLFPGTPGTLALRARRGLGSYWYRRHYDRPGAPQIEDFVCKEDDSAGYQAMQWRIEAALWSQEQVRNLRHLGLQVADKGAARVLVELHNLELFKAGLVLVGTLAFMAWLNELGVKAMASSTQDIDLARRQTLKLAVPLPFFQAIQATKLGFFAIPGLSAGAPSTSLKMPGKDGLRVDVLTTGPELGQVASVPELEWHAQTIPHFDYLLAAPRQAAVLAGGHCVPVHAPAPERLALHKLYSSTRRLNDAAKADKDLRQAATLLAVLVERDNLDLPSAAAGAPKEVLAACHQRLPLLQGLLAPHAQALAEVGRAFGGA